MKDTRRRVPVFLYAIVFAGAGLFAIQAAADALSGSGTGTYVTRWYNNTTLENSDIIDNSTGVWVNDSLYQLGVRVGATGNCGSGTVVQNVTSTGVQCVTDSVNGSGGSGSGNITGVLATNRVPYSYNGSELRTDVNFTYDTSTDTLETWALRVNSSTITAPANKLIINTNWGGNTASGAGSMAIGNFQTTTGDYGTGLAGYYGDCRGTGCFNIGFDSHAMAAQSGAIGTTTTANRTNTMAIGTNSGAWGDYCLALMGGNCYNAFSTAMGYNSKTYADNSFANGRNANATRAGQFIWSGYVDDPLFTLQKGVSPNYQLAHDIGGLRGVFDVGTDTNRAGKVEMYAMQNNTIHVGISVNVSVANNLGQVNIQAPMVLYNTATAPSAPVAGMTYFDTSSGVGCLYNGTAWNSFGGNATCA